MIANATGCSSIYSASIPSTPYTTNEKGQGPAFDNSLFEDFCEFGLGMAMGNKKMRERITVLLNNLIADDKTAPISNQLHRTWIDNKNDADGSKVACSCFEAIHRKRSSLQVATFAKNCKPSTIIS